MADQAYKHKRTGVVIAVAPGSTLEELVVAGDDYERASLDDLASDVPAFAAGVESAAERDEVNGWLTPPGVSPAPITGATVRPAGGDPLEEVLKGTTEEVNEYLDEHPDAVARVLELERAGKARKGVLEGRHRPATPPADEEPATPPAPPVVDEQPATPAAE